MALYHCVQKRYLPWFQFSYIHWDLFCYLPYDLSWKMFCVWLRRMCFLLLLSEMFCLPVGCILSKVQLKSNIFLLIFSLDNLSIVENDVFKYPTIIVLLSIFPFRSISICLIWIFNYFNVGCTCTYNCYIPLMNWHLGCHAMTFLVSYSFWLNAYFVFLATSATWESIYTIRSTSSVQSLSHVQLFATPWIAAHQASLSVTNSRTQTHVHRVSDAIQPSHPLSSPSPPAPNPSQHQSLFHWVSSSHEVARVLEFQL